MHRRLLVPGNSHLDPEARLQIANRFLCAFNRTITLVLNVRFAVGLATYSSDERFHVEHARHKGIWDLRIKAVRKDDEGTYECNLSHHPPESIFIEVKVVEAIAEITGAPDVHIDEGSTLRLECKIIQATENPSFVFW